MTNKLLTRLCIFHNGCFSGLKKGQASLLLPGEHTRRGWISSETSHTQVYQSNPKPPTRYRGQRLPPWKKVVSNHSILGRGQDDSSAKRDFRPFINFVLVTAISWVSNPSTGSSDLYPSIYPTIPFSWRKRKEYSQFLLHHIKIGRLPVLSSS